MKSKVLIVDDEPEIRFGIRDFLELNRFQVEEADSCQAAQELFQAIRPDVVILDYLLPDGDALELLPRLKEIDPSVPILILTAHGSIASAVRAIKEGAEQFLTKPIELPALLIIIQRLLDDLRLRRKQAAGKSRQARDTVNPFLGDSPAIQNLADQAHRVLVTDSPVLIQGETGVGKGVLAKWLHQNGPRSEEAFVDLNCAGLSKDLLESELFGHQKGAFTGAIANKTGLFEIAHQGTVFLDEMGDLDLQIQPKLLKVLEEKRFRRLGDVRDRQIDIRLIAATHQNLAVSVREKQFRSDLFFRISTIVLTVPPLRERVEDIPLLVQYLLEKIVGDLGRRPVELTREALQALKEYRWPGNVRELRNVLERAVLLSTSSTLDRKDLHFTMSLVDDDDPSSLFPDTHLTLQELEQRYIEKILQIENNRIDSAAKRLGISKSTLYEKIKKYQSPSQG